MVKLTPELINHSLQFINPCKERELDLRGHKISQIENMGATLDQFDVIDFSDNDLRKLDGFPYLPRLKCLLLNNNRILRIANGLQQVVPNLNSVVLTANNLQEFGDLDPLIELTNLRTLCLLVNPVCTKPYYREYIAYKFPNLRLLDYTKIKQTDRRLAHEFFRSKSGKEVLRISKLTFHNVLTDTALSGGISKNSSNMADYADMQRIRNAVKMASSLKDVECLSKILRSGHLPENFTFNEQ